LLRRSHFVALLATAESIAFLDPPRATSCGFDSHPSYRRIWGMMEGINEFFSKDPLFGFQKQLSALYVANRFGNLLAPEVFELEPGVIFPFTHDIPMRYWNLNTVKKAIDVLLSNPKRTLAAFKEREVELDLSFQNLFRLSSTQEIEGSLNIENEADLVRLSNEFIPDYLRWAEHVFGNILQLYWSVIKTGGVNGKYDVRRAQAAFNTLGLQDLLFGYSDTFRNAIAHGQVTFSGFDIRFGVDRPITSSDFLRRYDDLVRTCNALAIALICFCMSKSAKELITYLPLGIATRFAAGKINRPGLSITGAVLSNSPLVGKQLHISVYMEMRKRLQVLIDSVRIVYQIIKNHVQDYDRCVLQIDHGEKINSLCIIEIRKLQGLINENADISRIAEVFNAQQLLWFDEDDRKTRIKMWTTIAKTGFSWLKEDIVLRWHDLGVTPGRSRYIIRDLEPIPQEGSVKTWIRVVLRNPDDSKNRELIKSIIYDVTKRFKEKIFNSRGFMDKYNYPPTKSKNLFINVFREDGTLRWLKGGGWLGGNLIAVAEYIAPDAVSVLVDNPEETIRNIRIRYSMDKEKMSKALEQVMSEIYARTGHP
jgi:hypothetical protein